MAPEAEAPELMGFIDQGKESDCYFKRRPVTPEETAKAIRAISASCNGALCYEGTDNVIIEKIYGLNHGEGYDHKPKK